MTDALELTRKIYKSLAAAAGKPAPRLRTWNGEEWGRSDAAATIVLKHPGAFRSMFLPPSDLTAGEAYIFDDFDIEGDITEVMDFAGSLESIFSNKLKALPLAVMARRLPAESRRREEVRPRFRGRMHSLGRDRAAVRHHYDTGNEFFRQFLDSQMVYSCAYFLDSTESLDTAQERKLDVICRKLQLHPGMRMLDVGCGWGGLIVHAAARYGVTATGVTLSAEQAEYTRRRAKEEGVEDRVRVLQADYRETAGDFDAIASVGMFEHVGKAELGTYFKHLRGLLAPQGVLVNHGITTRDRARFQPRRASFVNTYVFPDGELVPIELVIEEAERAGFEARDGESLRRHYALTLRHWVANLERNQNKAIAAADELTYRIWRLYMAGSVVAFESAGISIYQLVLAAPDRDWTYGRRWALPADEMP